MTLRDPLAEIGPQLIMQGLMPDLPGRVSPLWDEGENVVFADGALQPVAGQQLLVAAPVEGRVNGLLTLELNGIPTVFYGIGGTIYRWRAGEGSVVRGSGFSTNTTHWSFARWGTWVVATNGIDAVQVDKGAGFVPLANTTFASAKLAQTTPESAFLVVVETAGGTEGAAGRVHWSHRDDIETWSATLTNFAGFKQLRNVDGPIQAKLPLGQAGIALYTRAQMHLVQFIQGPLAFGTQLLLTGFGAAGPMAVCSAKGKHWGFGARGIWTTDGSSYQYIDTPKIREFVFSRLDRDRLEEITAWYDRREDQLIFFYPTTDGERKGVVLALGSGAFSFLGFGRTAVEDEAVFPYAISGDAHGNLWLQSAPGEVPVGELASVGLTLKETVRIGAGYGLLGYGELGYGGSV